MNQPVFSHDALAVVYASWWKEMQCTQQYSAGSPCELVWKDCLYDSVLMHV